MFSRSRSAALAGLLIIALCALAPRAFAQAGSPPVVQLIQADPQGHLVAIVDEGDAGPTVSCTFTYNHDGTGGTLNATIDPDDGDCLATVPGGLTPGHWTITATATDPSGQSGSGTTDFTVPADGGTTTSGSPGAPGGGTGTGTGTAGGNGPSSNQLPPTVDPAPGLALIASAGQVDANQTLLSCSGAPIAITDISNRSGRVRILGLAAPGHAGQQVHIAFRSASNIVGTATVATDGTFRAIVPKPSHRIAKRDSSRYRATLNGLATPWLKYSRRLVLTGLHVEGSDLLVAGRLGKPFLRGTVVTVKAQTRCGQAPVVIKNITVGRDGSFEGFVDLPDTVTGFIARLSAYVRTHSGRQVLTYSIARPIQVRTAPPA